MRWEWSTIKRQIMELIERGGKQNEDEMVDFHSLGVPYNHGESFLDGHLSTLPYHMEAMGIIFIFSWLDFCLLLENGAYERIMNKGILFRIPF